MAPEPNDNFENNTNLNNGGSVVEDDNYVIVHEDDVEEQSSDENDISETEYAGYKLLQQEEVLIASNDYSKNVHETRTAVFAIDEDGTTEEETTDEINIDYQHLTCGELNDGLPCAGLGFPDMLPEFEVSEIISDRDDNIEMNEDKVELVKTAMAGFSLPLTNIPDWAKNISEDKWKESISISIGQMKGT